MSWKQTTKHCLASDDGYLISKYALQDGSAYVARCPKQKILHSGTDLAKAKAACVEHLNSLKVAS